MFLPGSKSSITFSCNYQIDLYHFVKHFEQSQIFASKHIDTRYRVNAFPPTVLVGSFLIKKDVRHVILSRSEDVHDNWF